ncbi:MAG: universal stress protein [Actinomycetaceae bacterium]|nr:universal stress protein [Actinomycetaceae bacterium]
MSRQHVILVGVDGSAEAYSAVDWATERASCDGSMIHILCTYALASYSAAALDGGYAALDDGALKEGAQRAVNEAVARVKKSDVKVTGSTEPGDAAGVMVEMSREVDMIVVGSRGGGGFADRLLGTVSSALPAHAHCPVVVVPKHTSGSPFTPVERIVVGVDGSEVASDALKKAVDEACVWKAKDLTAVGAVPIASGGGVLAWLPATVDRDALTADMLKGLNSAVEEAVAGRDVKVHRHVLDGSPAALLTEFSTAVDLVVVGNRGRGGFQGLLLGSTSQTVLAHSTCPVMVVPSRRGKPEGDITSAWERR